MLKSEENEGEFEKYKLKYIIKMNLFLVNLLMNIISS